MICIRALFFFLNNCVVVLLYTLVSMRCAALEFFVLSSHFSRDAAPIMHGNSRRIPAENSKGEAGVPPKCVRHQYGKGLARVAEGKDRKLAVHFVREHLNWFSSRLRFFFVFCCPGNYAETYGFVRTHCESYAAPSTVRPIPSN